MDPEAFNRLNAMNPAEKNQGHRKRLKQRFLRDSLKGFHDYEVVELLLTYAIPRKDVKPIAKELIRRFGFRGIFEASSEELSSVKGIGESAVTLVSLVRAVSGAYLGEQAGVRRAIRSPEDAVRIICNEHHEEKAERLYALYLSSKNEVLGIEPLHEGEITKSSVSPRKVIESAFRHNARSIIFLHSLPSEKAPQLGGVEMRLAMDLHEAASAIDIIVHYIVAGQGGYCSARTEGVFKGR